MLAVLHYNAHNRTCRPVAKAGWMVLKTPYHRRQLLILGTKTNSQEKALERGSALLHRLEDWGAS